MKTKPEQVVRQLNGQSELHKRPFTKLKVASVALLAGLMAAPMVFPKLVRAQDTSTHLISPTSKQLNPVLAKLPTLSLVEIRKLDSLSSSMPGDIDKGIFTAIAWPDYPTGTVGDTLSVVAQICQTAGCYGSGVPDKLVQVVSGSKKILATIDLTPLDKLYRAATGNELKFVRLVTTSGTDASVGPYAEVYVIPVEKVDGEIKGGTPILAIASPYKTKDVYTDSNILAMR